MKFRRLFISGEKETLYVFVIINYGLKKRQVNDSEIKNTEITL